VTAFGSFNNATNNTNTVNGISGDTQIVEMWKDTFHIVCIIMKT